MSESTALGHVGLMLGLLGVIVMLFGTAPSDAQYSALTFFFAIIIWIFGFAAVIGARAAESPAPPSAAKTAESEPSLHQERRAD